MGKLPSLTLVIGGAASGKSDFAEHLVIKERATRVYLATGQAFDDEMADKIARHKRARAGDGWQTVEEPTDLKGALSSLPAGAATLLDCATMWLTNLIMDGADIAVETGELLAALSQVRGPVVIVSNETGHGIVPDNKLARRFRQEQGQLNRQLAAQADLVVQVTVGLPRVLKGALPGDDI